MKLRTFKQQAKIAPTTLVNLVDMPDGRLVLVAVGSDGVWLDGGKLLYLHKAGTIERIEGVNPDLGFYLDDRGRIELTGEV